MNYNSIMSEIDKTINDKLNNLLENISGDYDLNVDELKMKYLNDENANDKKKKRGRKKKTKDSEIEMETYLFNDITYLIDKNNYAYTYDKDKDNAMLIGEKLINGTIKFVDGYTPVSTKN